MNTSHDLASLDMGFGEEADVVKPTLQPNPQLIYMTGNLSTTTFETAVGWHILADVNPTLDELLASRGTKRYIVQHKTGEEREKPYWNLNWDGQVCSLIVVAYGVKSSWEMNRHIDDRAGIAYGLGTAMARDGKAQISTKTGQPKKKPQLQLRAFIHELLGNTPEEGFNEWFHVSLSNYIVDEMLIALNEQFRVIDVYNSIMKAKHNPNRGPFWGFSIPMVIGKKKDVGPKNGPKSPIIPMVASIPGLSVNDPSTIQYLNVHRIPLHIQQLLRDGLLDETVAWSIERSAEIVSGKGEALQTFDQHADTIHIETAPEREDRPVNEEELAWIKSGYCVGNAHFLKQVCDRFSVSDASQLQLSHYKTLQAEAASYAS